MPYIDKYRRELIDGALNPLLDKVQHRINPDFDAGDLAYVLTKIVWAFLQRRKARYADFALVKGVLHTVTDELSRRVINPYEDGKMGFNGDVYDKTD